MGFREYFEESERRGREVHAWRAERTARTFTEHSFLWLFAWPVGLVLALMAPIMAIALWNALGDHRVGDQLAKDGVVTQARVIDERGWSWGKGGSSDFYRQARVSFTTEAGSAITAWVSTDTLFTPGVSTPEVRYSRSRPTVLRVVGEELPHRDDWRVPVLFAVVFLTLTAGLIALVRYDGRHLLGW